MNICPSCPRNTRREQPDDVYLYCEGHTAKNVYPYHFHAQGMNRYTNPQCAGLPMLLLMR